jgi:nucleotide-binding universal stress UspA family protein
VRAINRAPRAVRKRMYKHILIPTDGSPLADKAVEAGLAFASETGARVTVFTAVPEFHVPGAGDLVSRRTPSLSEHEAAVRARAEEILAGVVRKARAAGVRLALEHVQSDEPSEAIVAAAKRHGCDLIFMASHARRGLDALLHASATHGVLSRSSIPTVVYR